MRKRKPKDIFDDVDEDEESKSLHVSATGVTISSAKRTLLEKRTIDLKDRLPRSRLRNIWQTQIWRSTRLMIIRLKAKDMYEAEISY